MISCDSIRKKYNIYTYTIQNQTIYTCTVCGDGPPKTKQSQCLQYMWHGSTPLKLGQCHKIMKPRNMCRESKISRGCVQEAWTYPARDIDFSSTNGRVKWCGVFPATTPCRRVPGEWLDTPKLFGASMAITWRASMASLQVLPGPLMNLFDWIFWCHQVPLWFNLIVHFPGKRPQTARGE